ncbi:hypothetical protein NGB36_23770 [Streptomyces sp. RB6PN25]|uniref:Peptidase A1 domain-containing protein n=1 Tax=Streptomyces humicola TaxID=2953240 RepID=A0ABT1Q0T0_9ACTN|nr:hypothetical protein [Streptomyces humicola]MCQ4083531.1 hypothetical protein [Streptomyces humicola]
MQTRRALTAALTAAALALSLLLFIAIASTKPRVPASGGVSYTIPTLAGAANNLADGLDLAVNIGAGPNKSVEIDTGSLGLVVARSAIGPKAVDTGKKGYIEYTSSGKILSGEYFIASVTFQRPQAAVTTIPIRILGVTSSSCASGYHSCTPDDDINRIGMLGVGYSEYAKTDSPAPTAADNPFLQLTAMHDGIARPGYIITRNNVTLGLTPNERASFHTTRLAKALPPNGTGARIWSMPGCFAIPDYGDHAHCGSILFDTGISRMIVGLPAAERPTALATAIRNRTRIRIDIPSLTHPAFGYITSVGDPSEPIAPQGEPAASWAADTAFVNTGRELLAEYDYAYDAPSHRAGFRSDPE